MRDGVTQPFPQITKRLNDKLKPGNVTLEMILTGNPGSVTLGCPETRLDLPVTRGPVRRDCIGLYGRNRGVMHREIQRKPGGTARKIARILDVPAFRVDNFTGIYQ